MCLSGDVNVLYVIFELYVHILIPLILLSFWSTILYISISSDIFHSQKYRMLVHASALLLIMRLNRHFAYFMNCSLLKIILDTRTYRIICLRIWKIRRQIEHLTIIEAFNLCTASSYHSNVSVCRIFCGGREMKAAQQNTYKRVTYTCEYIRVKRLWKDDRARLSNNRLNPYMYMQTNMAGDNFQHYIASRSHLRLYIGILHVRVYTTIEYMCRIRIPRQKVVRF